MIAVLLPQVALESVSATHQLVSAVHTLALCTRPLLLAGFAPKPESAESPATDDEENKVNLLTMGMLGSIEEVKGT